MRHLALIFENLTTLACGIAALLAAGAAYRARSSWMVTSLLVAQCAFTLVGWLALCRPEMYKSRAYFLLFSVLFFPLQLMEMLFACHFRMPRWTGLCLIFTAGCAALFAADRIYGPIADRRDPNVDLSRVKMVLIWGAVLVFSGFLTLLALSEPLSPEMFYAARSLGICWLACGAWCWIYAASQGKAWDTLNLFVQPFIGVVCFAWLFFNLSGAQPESARQHSQDEAVSEIAWSEM